MTLIQFLGAGAAFFVVLGAGTLLLPRHVHVQRAAVIDADPGLVLSLAASGQGYQRFNPYRDTDPELAITLFGPETGIGSGFRFEGREGRGTQTVTGLAGDAVHYRIDLGAMGTPAQTIRAEPHDGGARVTWSMEADMGFNPVARIIGLFMDRRVGPTFERGLANLEAAA
ncbi:SRPBCC family protein [Roseibacterium sp. SDUM158016]|uniref:SRPBCC family protein n=1 Tax=Roseicyclus sediminis TaxID=2980997 RepID=UPI0021D17404|nr:SRPBCC family protein [Roseibacterium sp. SDUM158016]MCU4652724.1 SRPBCC family protein [Roseibacterium sp. SDUM158016]